MHQQQLESNPFALMMDPAAVFAAIERSECLARLVSRICRPLDKPVIGLAGDDVLAFDASIGEPSDEAFIEPGDAVELQAELQAE